MSAAVIAAVAAYAATNIDDLFINMIYFAQAESRREVTAVYVGKYTGSIILVLISMAGALGAAMLPADFVPVLAVVPLFMGIKEGLAALRNNKEDSAEAKLPKGLLAGTAAMTVASGADNIGVYIPLFAGCTPVEIWITVFVFGIMTGLWCYISNMITDIPALKAFIAKYKSVIVPVVYILLAVYIFMK